jgi:hypothetical protein
MKQFEQQLADAYARLNMYLNDRLENSEGLANIKFALTNLNALENAEREKVYNTRTYRRR